MRIWTLGPRRARLGIVSAFITAAVVAAVAQGRSTVAPNNTAPPTISGTASEGQTLTATTGTWSGTEPITYSYQWLRCDTSGANCTNIVAATAQTYTLKNVDSGSTIIVRVGAKNTDGAGAVDSAATPAVAAMSSPAPSTGCPAASTGAAPVAAITPPARLLIQQVTSIPTKVTASTHSVVIRVLVASTCHQMVSGAVVYVTATPYNQFAIPAEASTNSQGWATLRMPRLSGFPVSQSQERVSLFVRARKPGEGVLAGISTRRLVSIPVDLAL